MTGGPPDPADLSRQPFGSPFGPLTEGKKVRLPADIEAELMRRAARRGQTYSDYVRDVLTAHVVGPREFVRIAEQAAREMVGLGSESGEADR